MLIVPFKVLGKDWELRVLSNKKYNKKRGTDSLGLTLGWKRRIDLHMSAVTHNDECSLELINHELVHAYLSEICITSTNEMSVGDFEEVCAELMAKRGRELLDLGDYILVEIKKKVVYE